MVHAALRVVLRRQASANKRSRRCRFGAMSGQVCPTVGGIPKPFLEWRPHAWRRRLRGV